MKINVELKEQHAKILADLKKERMTTNTSQIIRDALRSYAEKILRKLPANG